VIFEKGVVREGDDTNLANIPDKQPERLPDSIQRLHWTGYD
jgi:hypothetical protein